MAETKEQQDAGEDIPTPETDLHDQPVQPRPEVEPEKADGGPGLEEVGN